MRRILVILLLAMFPILIRAEETPKEENPLKGLEEYIEKTRVDWQVPGVGVAIVKDDKVIFAKGFGTANIEKNQLVTPKTLFAIASITKSFTTYIMGKLVEEHKLDWNAPVTQYIPIFRMYDKMITDHVMVRDIVCHRTGLPGHDLVWCIQNNFTLEDFVKRLPYLENNKELRSTWQYNNLMYCAAGYLIEQITKKSWQENINDYIFQPLSMNRSNCSVIISQKDLDYATPYKNINDKITAIAFHNISNIGPAGAINSCVEEMANWMILHLNMGLWQNKQLMNALTMQELHSPQIFIPYHDDTSYALGWFIENYHEHEFISHGGNIDGFTSELTLCPKEKIGVIILTNLDQTLLPTILAHHVMDVMLKLEPQDMNAQYLKDKQQKEKNIKQAKNNRELTRYKNTSFSHNLEYYVGEYENSGYGIIRISIQDKQLMLHYNNEKTTLTHWHYDTFVFNLDEHQIPIIFQTNYFGEIDAISTPLEPLVQNILFSRQPDMKLLDPDYLTQFVGKYDFNGTILDIVLEGTQLKIAHNNNEEFLVATNNNIFNCEDTPLERIHFIFDTTGKVKELWVENEIGVLIAPRKP